MKKIKLIVAFGLFAAMAVAQKQNEFGLVARGGGVSVAANRISSDARAATFSFGIVPGKEFALGIFHKINFAKHFFISTELLYRYADYQYQWVNVEHYPYNGQYQTSVYQTKISTKEQSVLVPVKIGGVFGKNGRNGAYLGVGVSQIIGFRTHNRVEGLLFDNGTTSSGVFNRTIVYRSKTAKFSPGVSWSAGLFRNVSRQIALGIEFNVEHRYNSTFNEGTFLYPYVFFSEKLFDGTPDIRDISLTFRYNILK